MALLCSYFTRSFLFSPLCFIPFSFLHLPLFFFSFLAVHRGYSFWTSLILRVLEHVWSAALIHHSLKAESTSSGAVKLQVQREKKICKGNKEEIPNPVSIYKQLYAQELDWLAIPSYEDHGKILRLKQQFFFLCKSSLQNIIFIFKERIDEGLWQWSEFPSKIAAYLNDTHPTLAIPELMRLLMNDEGFGWNEAWDMTSWVSSVCSWWINGNHIQTLSVYPAKRSTDSEFWNCYGKAVGTISTS